jgi:hypothetical protein
MRARVCVCARARVYAHVTVCVYICMSVMLDVYHCVCIYSSSAVDTKMHVKVAIKKLARPFQSAVHAKRTYRELRMLKHMNHENVSRILICCLLIYFIIIIYFYWQISII